MYELLEERFVNNKTLFAEIVNKYYLQAHSAQFELFKDRLTPRAGIIHPLTKRELEIGYYHTIEGLTAHQIAEKLVVGLKTAEVHLTQFRFKCGTRGNWRWRLIAEYWYEAGRLGLDPPISC